MTVASQIKGAVHTAVRHDSAGNHVSGRSVFIDDMPELAGTLHAVLVKSPHAHAMIKSIHTTSATSLGGVHAVLTAADIPGTNDVAPIFENEPVLAVDEVQYVGHPVAVVMAETMDIARQAAEQVAVDYEPLAAILSIEEALKGQYFTSEKQIMKRGDAQGAIKGATHRISGSVSCGGQDHFYLEGHIALAVPQEDNDMLVYSSTQHPTEVQHGVATVLGVPVNAVTTETRRMGGGFGGKESQSTIIAALAALGANATRRPVKLRLTRDDDMVITGKRHDFLFRYEAGIDDDGRIEGIDLLMACRAGHVADLSSSVLIRALCHADNCYYLPNAHIHGYPCRTNTVSNTGFRGFGGPQGMVAIETIIDHIARDRGLDPDDVRRVNFYDTADRDETHYGQLVEDNIIGEIVDRLSREIDYPARKTAVAAFNRENHIIKKGIALMPVKFGISFNLPTLNQAGALVHVYTDGSVHLNHGGTEMGQGLYIKIAQVVASTFEIDVDHIKISATNTGKVPNTSATAASSGSDLNGMAAHDAAQQIKARMTKVAADHFEVDEGEIEFRNNHIYAGNQGIPFSELAKLTWENRVSLSATGFYSTPKIAWDSETMTGRPFYYFSYGAAVSEVAIDTLTGESRVLRTDILQDCGRSLNPAIDLGQIEGAFVQGMGWLTMEELWWDETGNLKTHGPSTYKIPGSRDVPPEFNVHILEDAPNREPTIFRSKAIGEPPLMLALSVWLAIRDAVSSLSDHSLLPALNSPATAEAILTAVDDIRSRMDNGNG
ncbi:MAG: xanthine dehydrogenase molybdopterin binding subunit [Rhodospirillaceae bacterium]|jgi:xanthine dehydrogenase large subunit|nr:xanthine dehydrogenase molybdopterin binding subunit [Rhodospirillaceae bacterium]MBT5456213.1 xanthine dehydrogenase molybdopterin binding subunit [Rhodospirillaceae bacterium]